MLCFPGTFCWLRERVFTRGIPLVIFKLFKEKLVCNSGKEEEKNHTISSKFQNIWSPQPKC